MKTIRAILDNTAAVQILNDIGALTALEIKEGGNQQAIFFEKDSCICLGAHFWGQAEEHNNGYLVYMIPFETEEGREEAVEILKETWWAGRMDGSPMTLEWAPLAAANLN